MLGYITGFENDIFDQFERMRRQMNSLFGDWGGNGSIRSVAPGTFPAINVGASQEQVDVYIFAAGLDRDSLDISLQQNLLTVSGERKIDIPEGVQSYRRERFNGRFSRVLTLPEDVDPDRVDARYHDGVLRITIQRREESRPRRVTIQ